MAEHRRPVKREENGMDSTERVRKLRPQRPDDAQNGELAMRPYAGVQQRQPERQFSPPEAVSQSSYLNEKDRHYRAAVTVENGRDLAERSVNGVLRLDARLREAEVDGASPRALAMIEQIGGAFGQSASLLVVDFMQRPYRTW
jgi:hypothetical protein